MEGLTKTIPPFSFSLTLPLPSLTLPFFFSLPPSSSQSPYCLIFFHSLFHTQSQAFLRHSCIFFLESARCTGNTRSVNTLVFEVRLRKASLSLSKQIFCLSPPLLAHVQTGALWSLMSLYSRGWTGLPGHTSGSNKTAWHHFTQFYQDVICFSSQRALQATRKVWLNSREILL